MTNFNPNSGSHEASDLIDLKIQYTACGYSATHKKDGLYEILEAVKLESKKFLVLCQNTESQNYVIFEARIYSFEKLPVLVLPSIIFKQFSAAEKGLNTAYLRRSRELSSSLAISVGGC